MIESMLEKAIEIEGLIRIIRDGNPLPEIYQMLINKTSDLAEEALKMQPSDFCILESNEKETDASETESTENEFHESENPEQTSVVTPSVEIEFQDIEKDVEEESGIEIEEESEEEIPEEDDIILDLDLDYVQEDEQPKTPDSTTQQKNAVATEQPKLTDTIKKKESRLRPAFSLNDRFLYSRELFEGNMKMFDSTLDFLEGIEEYSIIEDYFYSELEWDPENRYVASFMDILRPHFRE